jgi:hypothetical protein
MKTLVMRFDSFGQGHCLYTEALDLSSIGSLQIARASNIEFNQGRQEWEVRGSEGQILYSNPSRSACLDWEYQYFNR